MKKIYYVQVAGIPESTALQKFCHGLLFKDGMSKPAKAELVAEPDWLWPRHPSYTHKKKYSNLLAKNYLIGKPQSTNTSYDRQHRVSNLTIDSL